MVVPSWVKRFNQMVHLRSHLWVKSGNRLVQKQHFPGSTEGARQKDALLSFIELLRRKAPGSSVLPAVRSAFCAWHSAQAAFLHDCKTDADRSGSGSQTTRCPLHRRRKISLHDGLLGQIADLVLAQTIAHLDLPGNGLLQTEQRFHQGAFARTVFTNYTKIVPCVDLKIQRIQNGLSLVANEKVLTNELRHDGSFL